MKELFLLMVLELQKESLLMIKQVANDQTSAKKLMEMRYPGAKISWHKLPNKVKD